MTTFTPERKQRARVGTLLQHLLNQRRQTINTLPHICDPARQPHFGYAGAGQG